MTLRLEGVRRHFGRRPVLRGIDLRVEPGERVAVLGANGAGKTTLLRVVATLLRPTEGTVSWHGDEDADARRRALAFVPQEAPVYAELTPAEHVRWWARLHGQDPDADAVLADAGLSRMAHRPGHDLSGGQRRRLHLAMAFATHAPLLVLDEPHGGLDDDGRAWLDGRLAATDAAVLLSHHDEAHARAVAHRVVRVHGGVLEDA